MKWKIEDVRFTVMDGVELTVDLQIVLFIVRIHNDTRHNDHLRITQCNYQSRPRLMIEGL